MDGDRFWMVVSITETVYHEGFSYDMLPQERRPSRMYFYKSDAEDELLRLQIKYPGYEFVLLESISHFY